jgi:hypothetical protein
MCITAARTNLMQISDRGSYIERIKRAHEHGQLGRTCGVKTKLRGLSRRANYTDRTTAASQQS